MKEKSDLAVGSLSARVLYELDVDSRQSYSQIAKTLGTSPQVVKYHVESFYRSGLLQYCWPMVEYRKVGYAFGLYFFKLHNLDAKAEKRLYLYLAQHPFIPIVMRGEGYADLILGICAKGMFHLNDIVTELNNKFSAYFLEYDATIPIGFSQFHRSYLLGEGRAREQSKVPFTGADVKEVALDDKDRKVLSMVNFDARVPAVDIAAKTGLSISGALNRLQGLEKSGVIQSYTILPDHVKIGFPRHRVLIKLKNLSTERERALFTFCQLHPNIIHHLRLLGYWDLVLDIEIQRGEPFRKVLQELKHRFSDILHRVEPTYIYQIDAFRDIPLEHPTLNTTRFDASQPPLIRVASVSGPKRQEIKASSRPK